MDLCLVIDSSGNIRKHDFQGSPNSWQLYLKFLTSLVSSFNVGLLETRVGAVVFGEQVTLAFALNTYDTAQEIKQ